MAFDTLKLSRPSRALMPYPADQPARAHRLTLACVARDTLVETDKGHVPAREMDWSAQLWSATAGPVPTLRIAEFWADPDLLAMHADLCPMHVSANSLGVAAPARDLVLASQHAIQLDQTLSRQFGSATAARVAAHRLTDLPGIQKAQPDHALDYIAFLLDGTHIVRFNGIACETFAPEPATLETVFGLSLARSWSSYLGASRDTGSHPLH